MMNYVNGIVAMFHLAFEGRNIRSPRSEYHYNDVIMAAIASQITSLTIVYSTVYSDADQRKHQSFASLAFVRGIHRGPVNSRHKWPVTRKMFPFDDVIMHRFCMIAVSGLDYVSVSIFFFNPPIISKLCIEHDLCITWVRILDGIEYNHGSLAHNIISDHMWLTHFWHSWSQILS